MTINGLVRTLEQFFGKSPAFPSFEAEKETSGRLQLKPGQQVQAEVLENLTARRTLVRVAGELLKMELPATVRPGDRLMLNFLGEEPRPTFTLSRSANSGSPVSISDTGKLLGMLVKEGVQQQPAAGLPRISTILTNPPVDTAFLATRLREALTLNGVFYESHLAQWARGERALKEILKEPQGKSGGAKSAAPANQPHIRSHQTAIESSLPAEEPVFAKLFKEGKESSPPGAVAPESLPILREQLHTLHTGQFVWQGEVWPEQQLEWAVQERESGPDGEEGGEWETTLRLDLPKLGKIDALLRLTKDGLQVHINTESGSVADDMRSEQQNLETALSAAGVKFAGMEIEHGQDEPGV